MTRNIIPWILVGVLVVLLVWSLGTKGEEPVVIEKHTTDTLTLTRVDTVTITKVKEVVKEKVDTHYVCIRDSIYFPIYLSEYQFKEDGLFDFKVKGFDVSLVSAEVYPKTITQVVETTTNTTVKESRSALFINAGFSYLCGSFCPKVGGSLSLKSRWLISADIGLYNKEPMTSFTVGYNILNKK